MSRDAQGETGEGQYLRGSAGLPMLGRRGLLGSILAAGVLFGAILSYPVLSRVSEPRFLLFGPDDYAVRESLKPLLKIDLERSKQPHQTYGYVNRNRFTNRLLGAVFWYESGYLALRTTNGPKGVMATEIWLDRGIPFAGVDQHNRSFAPEAQASPTTPWVGTGVPPQEYERWN